MKGPAYSAPSLLILLLLLPVIGWASGDERDLPFEVTEERDRCDHYDPLKQPLFGELHLHTSYSVDAANIDTRLTPADAYRYARGERVGLPPWQDTRILLEEDSESGSDPVDEASAVTPHPYCLPGERCQYTATRTVQKGPGRELDFAAITDHSEQFGETNICFFEPTESCGRGKRCSLAGQSCNQPVAGALGTCVPDGYDSSLCQLAREELSRLRLGAIPSLFGLINNGVQNPARFSSICRPNNPNAPTLVRRGRACELNARRVWEQIGADAEEAYDRTASCEFTSFHAYEYTAMANNGRCEESKLPCWSRRDCARGEACDLDYARNELGGLDNLHRNIIFRNATTIDVPISNIEQPTGCGRGRQCDRRNRGPVASPVRMLERLDRQCSRARGSVDGDCEFLSIPHNSNLSGGSMFVADTLDEHEARVRNEHEPLVEITQIKGQSECRYAAATDTWWGIGSDEADPLCDFENLSFSRLNGNFLPADMAEGARLTANTTTIPPRSYVRNVLQSGIAFQASTGDENPFKLGFVGALDNHNGLPGQTNEAVYAKVGGHGVNAFAVSGQALDETNFLGLETNGGGLTVAWAEENSRDSIFHALENRETYATSGTRPIVRFYGGFDLPVSICESGNFARRGYENGVPMGGTLEDAPDEGIPLAPRFAVSALWDAGWGGRTGTRLQRAQIIKGWVDRDGQTREKVIDATDFQVGNAGDTTSHLPNADSCEPAPQGHTSLCAVWTDPDFDASQHAFYYARVLEQPSCRWSKYYCDARSISCDEPMGTCRAATASSASDGQGCNSLSECPEGSVCEIPVSYTAWEYQQCCGGLVPDYVQQRAWTSPIWYTP